MTTLVCLHAHPDDECISTGGTMMMAAEAGHDVVLIVATRGEQGEPASGVLAPGEMLGHRREIEVRRSAEILGVSRIEFLPYEDSGMIGEPANDNPVCFWQADLEVAAEQVAQILRSVGNPDDVVLTIYDSHGGYGHPDHIQVHRVGTRAAQLAGVNAVYEATMNRTEILEQMENSEMAQTMEDEDRERISTQEFGTVAEHITHHIDVARFTDRKRQAMVAHESQITEDSFFLQLPPEAFHQAFGSEWFIESGQTRDGDFKTALF